MDIGWEILTRSGFAGGVRDGLVELLRHRVAVTGVHIDHRGYGRLTIARIDGKEIETWSFER